MTSVQQTRYSVEETARRGDDIYERQIRPLMEAEARQESRLMWKPERML